VIEFQITLAGLEEVTRWILSWGSKAKVLAPPALKQRVRNEIEKMMNSHREF
jgi:predicted DNA-binding transcriptional regulator YafY